MIDLGFLKDRRIGVLGLGRTGMAAAEAMKASGVDVVAWDDGLVGRAWAERGGIPLVRFEGDGLAGIDTLILSPGIPRTWPTPHPVVAMAVKAGVRLVSDIDLLAQAQPRANYLGITGTNGKSTTTALIGHLLTRAGVAAETGGNLGFPALSLAPLDESGWYVLEVSSFQLETISAVPWTAGVFINITPDHLDRYAGMADYVAAKRALFERGGENATAIVGAADDWSRRLIDDLRAAGRRVVPISAEREVEGGVHAIGGRLVDDMSGEGHVVADLAHAPALPGQHNWQNAAAAYAACRVAGVSPEAIAAGLAGFPGLKHRQQPVDTILGIRFVNDSKGTNPDAAAKALGSYQHVYWVAGGRAKGDDFSALDAFLPRIRHACLIGEATEALAAYLQGRVRFSRCTDLDAATSEAFTVARAERLADPVVLLSPACTSWDQFVSYEARGEAFIASVRAIAHRCGVAPQRPTAGEIGGAAS
ncbi:MAG: UDP-N-acetylmuramoyl-L-alanine--D-glutamate ligase [Azospirillaceae bacterium]